MMAHTDWWTARDHAREGRKERAFYLRFGLDGWVGRHSFWIGVIALLLEYRIGRGWLSGWVSLPWRKAMVVSGGEDSWGWSGREKNQNENENEWISNWACCAFATYPSVFHGPWILGGKISSSLSPDQSKSINHHNTATSTRPSLFFLCFISISIYRFKPEIRSR